MSAATKCLAALLLLALMGAPKPAWAGDLPDLTRRMADLAMAESRWEDLEATLSAASTSSDRLPLLALAAWWRPTGAPEDASELPAQGPMDPLTRRRLAWLRAGGPGEFPSPQEGEIDRWPVLAALIADRVHRETLGVVGLPLAGPLEEQAERMDPNAEQRSIWFLRENTRWQMAVSYRQMPPSADEVAQRASAESLASRNGWLALVAITLLLLMTAAWVWRSEASS